MTASFINMVTEGASEYGFELTEMQIRELLGEAWDTAQRECETEEEFRRCMMAAGVRLVSTLVRLRGDL